MPPAHRSPPSDYLRRLYFDTITHSPHALRLLLDTVGPERVMLGSDFPFDMGAPDPRSVVAAQDDLSPASLTRIYADTAREFLGVIA